MAESEEELKSLLMKVKEESEEAGLKLNIQKTKIMTSGPISSWAVDEETVETVADFIFGGFKNTADGDCNHEIKRHLLLGRKAMTNLDSVLKSRDITLLTKAHIVKAMVFPVVMYGCESWTIKKANHWRTDAFELWCWRRLLRVPWTTRRSNQSILKEISSKYSLEGLMLKLKRNTLATWCEELTHLKRPWCWERLKAGGEGDGSGWDGWMASPTQWTWVWASSGRWWRTGKPGVLLSMDSQRVGHAWATDQYLLSLGHILRNEIAESYGNSRLNILRNSQTMYSMVATTLYIPTSNVWRFNFSTSCPTLLIVFLVTAILVRMKCYLIVALI